MPGEGGGGGEEQGDCHGQDGEQHLPQLGQDGQDGQGGRVMMMMIRTISLVTRMIRKMMISGLITDDCHLDQLSLRTQED